MDPKNPSSQHVNSFSSAVGYVIPLLCTVGFVLKFRPSLPFLVPWLVDEKDMDRDSEVDNQILPMYNYVYIAALLVVGPLTERTSYKFVIICECLFHAGFQMLLLLGTDLWHFQAAYALNAIAVACSSSFRAFVYILVPKEDFQRGTSWINASSQVGGVFANFFSQIIVSYISNNQGLMFSLSIISQAVGLIIVVAFPTNKPEEEDVSAEKPSIREVWSQFVEALSQPGCARWILLNVLNVVNMNLGMAYATSMWHERDPDVVYHGYAQTAAKIGAVAFCLVPIYIKPWLVNGGAEIVFFFTSALMLVCLFFHAVAENVYVLYVVFAIYVATIYFNNSIANAQMAQHMGPCKCFATVFSFATVCSTLVGTIFQFVQSAWLQQDIIARFWVYTVYQFIVCCIILMFVFARLAAYFCGNNSSNNYDSIVSSHYSAIGQDNDRIKNQVAEYSVSHTHSLNA